MREFGEHVQETLISNIKTDRVALYEQPIQQILKHRIIVRDKTDGVMDNFVQHRVGIHPYIFRGCGCHAIEKPFSKKFIKMKAHVVPVLVDHRTDQHLIF